MTAAQDVMPLTGVLPILMALGLSRATFYRQQFVQYGPVAPRPTPARALPEVERQAVLEVLHSERFVDQSPAEVVATLADEGTYLASARTMYRILNDNQEVRERRNQLRHPEYRKPELVATGPNQVWSWDITKLKTFVKFAYLHLYVILDIYSRYVVGWLLAENEKAALANRLISETCERQNVQENELILHSDRGAPMRSGTLSQLLARLDVTASFSRPHVSDDNPFSESQFHTLKYSPGFPDRFGGLDDGMVHCKGLFDWYNNKHHHSGIAFLTARQVHYGEHEQALVRRHEAKLDAWRAHPERFINGQPRLEVLAPAVYINPPKELTIPVISTNSSLIDANFQAPLSQNA